MRRALALVLLLGACGGDTPTPDREAPRFPQANLVIVSLDTLRADDTSMLGGPADLSPTLAEFAKSSVLFTEARSQAPHTAPSHMSLFTGTYPSIHGVQNVVQGEEGPIILAAPTEIPTLAEMLKAAGFATMGLTDGGNLNPPHGFDRGFDTYTYELAGAKSQVDAGLKAISALALGEPRSFLFWHTYQIHAPYCPPSPYLERYAPKAYEGPVKEAVSSLTNLSFRERWGQLKTTFWKERDSFGWPEAAYLHGLYRGGVAYTDGEVARLFAGLRDAGFYDDAIIIVLSDHGEEFFEHGAWQHEQLFEECLRVPLMIRLPGGQHGGRRIDEPVALMDVLPTVLELLDVDPATLGLPHPPHLLGKSLVPLIAGTGSLPSRPIISELRSDRAGGPTYDWMVALTWNGMKYVYDEYRGPAKDQRFRYLYDLTKDPDEQVNLIEKTDNPRVAEALPRFESQYAGFKRVLAARGDMTQVEGELDDEARRQLEELGYIDAGEGQDEPEAKPEDVR